MANGKNRKKKMNKRFRIAIAVVACLIVAGVSITVYSKYYKTGYSKGISIASGFYFSSSYMTELSSEDEEMEAKIEKINTITDLLKEDKIVDSLPIKANTVAWANNLQYQFKVDVNNFANQLLYNDENLNVKYKIEFVLLDDPEEASYAVRRESAGEAIPITKTSVAEFEGELKGGKVCTDTYYLDVRLISTLQDYHASRILVMAYPTGPSYLQGTKKLAGIIIANYEEKEMEITSQGFTIEDDLTEEDWAEQVKDVSALKYQVKTTGNYIGDVQGGQEQMMKITWNSNMYELYAYDKYKMDLEAKYTDPSELAEHYHIDEAKGTGTMIIETQSYQSIEFVFFKKESFDTVIDGLSSIEDFKNTVYAEMVK